MSRSPHQPTERQRQMVQIAKAAGLTDDQVSGLIGIDLKTLRKHYRSELDNANSRAIAAVAANLYKRATSDAKEAVPAAIFWLKTRGGWRERDEEERADQQIQSIKIEVIGGAGKDNSDTAAS